LKTARSDDLLFATIKSKYCFVNYGERKLKKEAYPAPPPPKKLNGRFH